MAKLCDRIISAIDKEEIKLEEQREKFKVICMDGQELNQNLRKNLKENKPSSKKSKKTKENLEDMKNITKRQDGLYMIRKVLDGKRITLYAKTFAEAREKLQLIKKRKVQITAKDKKITFGEYSKQWFKLYKEPFVKERSKSEIRAVINKLCESFENQKINKISTLCIQEYINGLKQSRTKEKICLYFNAILKKAVETRVITYNPFDAVIKDKKIKNKRNAFTFDEQEVLLHKLSKTNIEHEIMTYLMTGCRPNELPTNEDFDFKNNLINIYGSKNQNSMHRRIKISQEYADYMKNYLAKTKMKTRQEIHKIFKQICEELGFKDATLYKLRHTFATNHFVLGTPTKYVQTWLGHGSIQMTMDIYTDIDETSSKEKIIKLYNNFYYLP